MRTRVLSTGLRPVVLASVIVLGLLGTAPGASASTVGSRFIGSIAPSTSGNEVDCNGWSNTYTAARPAMQALCTDPIAINAKGQASRLLDNGWYVGHDEPSVKFISSTHGSGNSMTYYMQLPVDPTAAPTADGSVTDYGELSVAPWFGLPLCDPHSYPQNPCTPDSDSNGSAISDPKAAGSAFMELQFYPPGFTPFFDSESCSTTKWCSALTIDSLECTFGFAACNGACEEPVNFAFLQRNGIPAGPPAPQDTTAKTFLPNLQTLMLNPGDVLEVSINDPAGGLFVEVHDLTTGQTGYMQASASNGFANTNIADCSGNPSTFHAEYDTASQQNQVPWAALEGGVLMEQEIGHFESCSSLSGRDPFGVLYADGSSYSDPFTYDACNGGVEGPKAVGEGPCQPDGTQCLNATTQGFNGPTACPSSDASSGFLCEYADGYCFPGGVRLAKLDGRLTFESARLNGCFADRFQNGDLDFDGNNYQTGAWPDGSPNTPTSMRYAGPFTNGQPYPAVQFESDAGGSSNLCNTITGQDCTVPPISAKFYPFWSLNNSQTLAGSGLPAGSCIWNFGDNLPGVTVNNVGGDGQYGSPNVARYGGTIISGVRTNPTTLSGCGAAAAASIASSAQGSGSAGAGQQALVTAAGTGISNPFGGSTS